MIMAALHIQEESEQGVPKVVVTSKGKSLTGTKVSDVQIIACMLLAFARALAASAADDFISFVRFSIM